MKKNYSTEYFLCVGHVFDVDNCFFYEVEAKKQETAGKMDENVRTITLIKFMLYTRCRTGRTNKKIFLFVCATSGVDIICHFRRFKSTSNSRSFFRSIRRKRSNIFQFSKF